MELQAGNHKILPAKTGKLLGCEINGNGSTISETVNSKQSLIRQLTSRVNGLTMVSSRADFNTRLMVANGLVISKLCYCRKVIKVPLFLTLLVRWLLS